MSWFSITDLAKNALSEAQRKIDKALDIQSKGDVTLADPNSSQGVGGARITINTGPQSAVQPNVNESSKAKKANVSTKAKPRTTKSTGSTLKAKKITTDISDDFFSVLEDEKYTSSSRQPRPLSNKSSSAGDTTTSIQDKSPRDIDEFSDVYLGNDKPTKKILPGSTFTEVPLVVTNEQKPDQTGRKVEAEISPNISAYSDVPLEAIYHPTAIEAVSEEFLNSLEPNGESGIENEAHNESGELDTSDDVAYNTVIRTPDGASDSTPSQDPVVERNVSPSGSTAASSEIDILDHESNVSEVSSRCNDGQIFIQSPLHLRNIDNVDSDASQVLSPVPDEVKHPPRSPSPRSVIDNESQSTDSPMPSHSFQPVSLTDAQEPTQSFTQEPPQGEEATITTRDNKPDDVGSSEQTVIHNVNLAGANYTVLSEKMEVYEQQLMNLSLKNAQLNEENDNLRSEIVRTREECRKEENKDFKQISDTLKSYENNNKLLNDEKANLTKQMAVLRSQLAARMTNEQVQNAIAEKEESIKGLMEEGEVLSKKHLQQNNLIKKLKSQTQERDAELKTLRDKVTKYEEENIELKDELKVAQGQGQEQRETSLRISDAYEQRDRETQILQEKLSHSEEKQRTLQVNLDAAYKEIGDLHKQVAEQESKTSTEWISKEAELIRQNDLDKKKNASEQEHQRQLLMLQIMELNNSVSRAEAAAARKDDDHRKEIRELQQRLQESDGRNQDLSDNVSNATRPLLRQIENLQATHASQQRSWYALEKNLNSRIGEAQAELHGARENERVAQNNAIEAISKATAYEKHIQNDKRTMTKQANEIESLGNRIDGYKSENKLLTEELDELKTTHKESVHKSRKERLFLENQLQMEKVRAEADRKKYTTQQEALQKEKDKMLWSRSEITSVSSNQIMDTESVVSSNDAFHSADAFEKQFSSSSLPGLTNQLSFEGGRSMSISNVLENLQTQLKLRDGEIAQLRGDINMLERTRSSMAEEIVRLTNLNEDLDGVSEQLQDMKDKHADVESRYSAILTMYGEKEEENEELRMDLADVKAMYRQQINDLLKAEPS